MVTVFDHPLIKHKLSILRMKQTGTKQFKEIVTELSMIMGYEVTRDLGLEEMPIETPICKTTGYTLAGKKIALVPILRNIDETEFLRQAYLKFSKYQSKD